MAKNRDYRYKDVDMLMASKTVAESFGANISELSTVRKNWTHNYAAELNHRIDNAIESFLGIDPKREWREATAHITAIHYPAVRDLSFFKTQVEDDFEKHPAMQGDIFKSLGFTKSFRSTQKGNIEALAELLSTFKRNMNEELRTIVTSLGLNPTLIDTIIGYANIFAETKVSQDSLMETTKEITPEGVAVFNRIYNDIVDVCRIASEYYHFEPHKKELFTFSKVMDSLDETRRVFGYEEPRRNDWDWMRVPDIVGM